jgi:3-hydroxyisobutyrate dehydrogenase-like beta-hydroxyacid dehydrogenase
MGGAMVRRLVESGFDVTAWNRDRTKAEASGVAVADTAMDAVASADVILTSLADDAAVREVYLGPDGVAAGGGPGKVIVETSTIDPGTVADIGRAVDATGAWFIDAPVSGSVSTVEAGQLTIMAGGDRTHLDRARPVLAALASKIVEVGPRGAGATTKLAVNGFLHGLNVALAEALVLAEKAGVDRSIAYEVFASGAGGAPFLHYKREAYEHPEDATVAFSLDLVAKDLELITRLADRLAAPMEQTHTALEVVRSAISAGLGDRDMSAVAVHLRGDER